MDILKFDSFCESYLEGGRAPLYHYTDMLYLIPILKSDTLKTQQPSFPKNSLSISLTRTEMYLDKGNDSRGIRFVLDTDLLIKKGYNPVPVDEVGIVSNKYPNDAKKFAHIMRHSPSNITFAIKNRTHDKFKRMVYDFEERIYKDITPLGKYILYIDVRSMKTIDKYKDDLIEYSKKYPHIKYRLLDYSDNHFRFPKEITL